MLEKHIDQKNKFYELFDSDTGLYVRSGVINSGIDTGVDPFMRSFPGLIDIGVMGQCNHGMSGNCHMAGIECYQNGLSVVKENMSFSNFRKIVDQCKGKVFQFALGGRGDLDQHDSCEDILFYCRDNGIVPNFTTSGFALSQYVTNMLKDYVGAVAVSWYRAEYTHRAIAMLIKAGIKTNIHYILGKHSIEEAIFRLEKNLFPEGINAIIFLLHKPVGMGSSDNILTCVNSYTKQFFELIDKKRFTYKIGFDSCSCAGIINYTDNISFNSIDYCEGGRFSCYIDAQMNMMPCSFATDDRRWQVCLNHNSIEEAWNSKFFNDFRSYFTKSCSSCSQRHYCGGGCPLYPEITLCLKEERLQYTIGERIAS